MNKQTRDEPLSKNLRITPKKSSSRLCCFTPDDQGSAANVTTLQPRARQNVILELGYFLASSARTRVAALYKGVELPSDYSGILYTQFDEHGAWRFKLAKELKTAGYDIDLNIL